MGRIQILDDKLANQIAAGEVVERPASVVKELLENAVDAGATAITVEIVAGGVRRLRVVDDGHGMGREDALLAVRRHATSKLKTARDLAHIMTLGFRGEALPSIASVSRFSIRTREAGAVGALRVQVEGGAEPTVVEAPGPVGTEVLVEDLFFNVPARLKFLKKEATEASHVSDAAQRIALCYPGVAFRFVKDGRTSFDLPRHETLAARVEAVFGQSLAGRLVPVEVPGPFGLDGLLGPPDEARGTARHYHTFVNGRFVRDRVIMSAVQAAYGQRLQRGRHPFVVLRLRLPAEAVDVNVHPAKTEVRFVDTRALHRLVGRALDAVLRADPWSKPAPAAPASERAYNLESPAPEAAAPPGPPATPTGRAAGLDAHRRRIFDVMEKLGSQRAIGGGGRPNRAVPRPVPVGQRTKGPDPQLGLGIAKPAPPAVPPEPVGGRPPHGEPAGSASDAPPDRPSAPDASPTDEVAHHTPTASPDTRSAPPRRAGPPPGPVGAPPRPSPAAPEPARPSLGPRPAVEDLPLGGLAPLGVVAGLWLCAAADGLVGLDLREARVRVAFDALADEAPPQTLSPPPTVELDADARARLGAAAQLLSSVGLVAAPFGGATYAIESLPRGVPAASAEDLLRDALALDPCDAEAAGRLGLLVAERVADGPLAPLPDAGLLRRLQAVRSRPPGRRPLIFVLTEDELRRRLQDPA